MLKIFKIRVFRSGKLSGEGAIRPFPGGTIGSRPGRNITSPSVEQDIRVWKTLRGKIAFKLHQGIIRSLQIDSKILDIDTLSRLGILKKSHKSEILLIPSGSKLRLIFQGFEVTVEEEDQIKESVLVAEPETILLSQYRRKPFSGEHRFLLILTASLLFYMAIHTAIFVMNTPEINVRKDIPRRFTRFIYEPVSPEIRVVKDHSKKLPADKREEKEKGEAKKGRGKKKVEKVASAEKPKSRQAIRERIASKGVLGILTGRGRAGQRYGSDVLNQLSEVSDIDVQLDKVASLEKPVSPADRSLAETDIAPMIGESGLGEGKGYSTKTYRTETGAEMELSGEFKDKSRSAQVIYSIIESYLGGIKYVYNGELKKNPSLSGRVTVAFIITPEGTVKEITIKDSNLKWPSLEHKIMRRISHWKFPPAKVKDVRVVFPFLFFPSM